MNEGIDQTHFVSNAFDTSTGEIDNIEEKPKPKVKSWFENKIWGLQVKIWSIILLIFGVLNIPFTFFVIEPRQDQALVFMLKFNWEPLLTCLLAIPSAILGIIGVFRQNVTVLKLVERNFLIFSIF